MRKLAAFAVFAAITVSAAMASAASIDSTGVTSVDIKAPSSKISVAAADRVVFDSEGRLTAAQIKTVTPKVIPIKDENKVCLDSSCNTVLF